MNNQCPSCQRLLYDRRLPYCGYCGAAIPKSLQFTTERMAEIDKEVEELANQRREQLRIAREEEEQREMETSGLHILS